jgi:hypothetical protein
MLVVLPKIEPEAPKRVVLSKATMAECLEIMYQHGWSVEIKCIPGYGWSCAIRRSGHAKEDAALLIAHKFMCPTAYDAFRDAFKEHQVKTAEYRKLHPAVKSQPALAFVTDKPKRRTRKKPAPSLPQSPAR